MLTFASQAKQFPFYLWIVGIHPILHLYSANFGLVIDKEVLTSLIWILSVTTIAYFLTNHLLRNRHKAAFLLGIFSLSFSYSGHIYGLVIMPEPITNWTLTVTVVSVITVSILLRVGSQRFQEQLSATFNLIALVMLTIPTLSIGSSYLTWSLYLPDRREHNPRNSKITDSEQHPDIYYIIPDGYPSDVWLQEAMNYDNSQFTRELEDRGFTVAKKAQSNYAATLPSLASTLNMQYFDQNQSSMSDLDYLRHSIAESKVAHELQQLGYTYIQFLSGYLIPSFIADINRDFAPSGPFDIDVDRNDLSFDFYYKQSFLSLYIDTTFFRIFRAQLEDLFIRDESAPFDPSSAQRFLATIDEIESIVAMPEATFAIIHLMKPHNPTVFNEHGDIVEADKWPSHEKFFAEFGYINAMFLQMIDTIVHGSRNQPIVVFQADHGTIYGKVWTNDWKLLHFDTYASYHLPDSFSISIPQPFTLINTFPLIMNEVFDRDYTLQDNKLVQLIDGYDAPFNQRDVTEFFQRN